MILQKLKKRLGHDQTKHRPHLGIWLWICLTYSKEREPEYEVCLPNEIANGRGELLKLKREENNIEILTEF